MKPGLSHSKSQNLKSKVKKTIWLFLFAFILFADLISIYFESEISRYFTKPLLMPLLVLYLILATGSISSSLKKWLILALSFSWAGDVLLMFESMNGLFFIFGLVAFLIAHIFYIILFDLIRVKEKVRQSLLPLLPIAFYYLALIGLLQPHLGEMKKPVSIYGLIISIMLSFAIDLWRIKDRKVSFLIITGAFLFIVSDSLLAINKFYNSFEYAGISIMLTYGVAQLLITLGTGRYITSNSKQ
jgi:uncharacterized membrane protein YhhN